MSTPALAVTDLHFAYPDGQVALAGATFHVHPGERVALLGPNGAGKTTLVLHLNGILRPRSGSVHVAGLELDDDSVWEIRRRTGVVFQDPDDQLFSPTVRDDVAFGPLHMGLAASEVDDRVGEALDAVGLGGFGGRMPHHMSVGERRRAAIATVLSMRPAVLAADEPTSGLDARGRRDVVEVLRSLGQTVVVATHDLGLAREALPRSVVLDHGRIVADGPTDRILGDRDLLERHGLLVAAPVEARGRA